MSAAPPDAATTRWILWAALLASVLLYAAIPLLVAPPPSDPPLPALPGLFAGFGLAAAGAALLLHHLALRRPIAHGALDPVGPAHAPRVLVVLVIAWVLAEVPAILGLVLALLGGGPQAGWGLALLSALTLLALAPRLPAPAPSSAALARGDGKIG